MPRRRTILADEVRRALDRLEAEGRLTQPVLPPPAMARLRGLTEMMEGMLEELSTGKTLWRFEPTARALEDLIRRIEQAEDYEAARSALSDLLGVLTDENRWR
jgi:hypothetical protein